MRPSIPRCNRNLEYHLGYSRWTLFGRIVRQLDADFRETIPASQQRALDDCFHQARGLLRTTLYHQFEVTFKSAFIDQLKRTTHILEVEFHTFDPLNYYRSIQPLLLEDGKSKHPSEAGQGMRNLILLALFRAYGKVFKSDAIIAVEEPEIYLHPHAQRSLSALFDDLARAGNQIFYPTHSGNFINIEYFDRIYLVEKCKDSADELCTEARQVFIHQLLTERQKLHPNILMNGPSLRERYRNICNLEHNEAFFARKIILVEGETEEYALPICAKALGDDYDANGISVVNAHGKNNLDQFYQLVVYLHRTDNCRPASSGHISPFHHDGREAPWDTIRSSMRC
jgi:putative ATP-dependent endonuclease of the OLD family